MPRHARPILRLLLALTLSGASGRAWAGDDPGAFETEIRPILRAKCVKCHREGEHKAELDLATPEGLLKGGESGPAVVPGKPDESLLFEKVHGGEMPPSKKERLTEAQVESIRRWIAAGASTETEGTKAKATAVAITQHDAIPIFLRHCTVCHGRHQQQGKLDLSTREGMLKGGKSGPAVVPGKPEESLILKRIGLGQMPPPEQLVEASVKPVDDTEAETLARWIKAGAPELPVEPDIATTSPDPLVSDKDRDFWAFQTPKAVAPPPGPGRNPIDAFIGVKLKAKGLSPSPEAGRLVLMRRAYFDLTGLPPEPDEVDAYLADKAPDAYERLIDRLLASPRYGERWGRYWLDAAGYADSEGKREQDLPRHQAWRYRDYVIKSLNADKPYDRFLLEQLAGDELAPYEGSPVVSEEVYDNLVATGFLRMAPDASWANITGYATDRVEVIADEIDVLGSAVMGLTLKCARCHTHKFDPIPHRDYYRLIAVFKGALDEYDWLKPDVKQGLGPISVDPLPGRLLPVATAAERRAWAESEARLTKEVATIRSDLAGIESALSKKHFEARLAALPEVLRDDLKKTLATPADKRDPIQKYLADKFEKGLAIDREALKTLDPDFKAQSDAADARIAALEARRRPEPMIQALWDRGHPTPTYIYRRGDSLNPGRLVGPGVPSMLTDGKTPFEIKPPYPGASGTGRRLAFARWLVRPDHPLTARVAVNRVWKGHMGSGIVKTLGNFGKAGTPPTHPELLDWLAREFVDSGWSLKAIHRLIMTSATYRQASDVTADHERLDPQNDLYSRMPLVRLDAESLYDTSLLVAGRLDERSFGPADPVAVRPDGLVTPVGTAEGWRRMIYVRQARKQVPTHLENFDYPQMNPNCIERRDSIVPLQALQLMNTGMVHELADAFADRLLREAGDDPARAVDRAYRVALSRPPTDEERRVGIEAIGALTERWAKSAPKDARRKALSTYCHAILNSAGLLYVD